MVNSNNKMKFKKNHFLKIFYDRTNNIINIIGNNSGLEYVANVCCHLAKKKSDEHWHLSFAFNSLTEDSIETVITSKKS